jgi:dihydroorotate dehydrogenase
MRVTIAGVEFSSPVIGASGTFGYGIEFEDIIAFDRIGGFVTKGLSREPMAGNPTPRIIETAAGMMNAIRLHYRGLHRSHPRPQRRLWHRHVRAQRKLPQHQPWRHGLRH